MNQEKRNVTIFTMPIQYPCGPKSGCCGPIGQSEDDIRSLKETIEKKLAVKVEVKNVTRKEDVKNCRQVLQMIRSFGPMATPIITLGEDVISLGSLTPDQAVATLREKMKQAAAQ